jgi:uncharacterized membrane protein (DUF4010 family)
VAVLYAAGALMFLGVIKLDAVRAVVSADLLVQKFIDHRPHKMMVSL